MIQKIVLFLFIVFQSGTNFAQIQDLPTSLSVDHPRIMFLKEEEQAITKMINESDQWEKIHEAIIQESEAIISLPPVERIQIGRRLLDKSREALRRIFHLSYAFRMTGEEKFLERAERELLAVSNFSDWNPTHFLDVAEMTMAVAIGYDWLFDHLSNDSKHTIREAIVKKGLEPSYNEEYNWFLEATHNWNQVCNAGMTFGALAVYEDYPELSKKTIERAIETIKLPMHDYQPEGAYPEGYSYWDYGTTFNVLFLSAIEKVYDSDFNLNKSPGFLETAGFYRQMTGSTGLPYNWGDAGSGTNLTPAMFWFAKKNNDPSLLWIEKDFLQEDDYSKFTQNRIFPATMIWGLGIDFSQIKEPSEKVWVGQGANPVAMMRTSWSDPDAIYLGLKAGSPSVNHGHMDIGSFIMEAEGVRWAMDFGMQNYESLESKGIQLFGTTQDAQRWSVFRLNNFVHNTLTVDKQLQLVKGYARIDDYSDATDFQYAVSDISSVYNGQLKKAKRGVGIVNEQYVIIQDELEATGKATTVRWNMLTPANVSITENNMATLEKDGETLFLKVEGLPHVKLKTWNTEPQTDYDEPNSGTIMVGFELELEPNAAADYQVYLFPAKSVDVKLPTSKALENWGTELSKTKFKKVETIDEQEHKKNIKRVIPIDSVWAGHPVGFALLTQGDDQFISYYNADRHMVVGQRNLSEDKFKLTTLPVFDREKGQGTSTIVNWDSHNYITMGIDKEGYIHLSGNMHVHPLTYFKSTAPGDISTLKQVREMVGSQENRCTYPKFMSTKEGELIFHYRDGGSGDGNEIYNIYSCDTEKWSRLLDTPLTDGQGDMNAYASQPTLREDDWYHMYWVWRDTPDCSTNHDLSYIKSPDMKQWYNAFGEKVELSVTFENKTVIVDPIPVKGGIINLAARLCLDKDLKPLMAYHKYDEEGNLQFYVAKAENNQWTIKQVTDWDYRWYFSGNGSINNEVLIGEFIRREDGKFELGYDHIKYGKGTLLMDENFNPIGKVLKPASPLSGETPEGDFPNLQVQTTVDLSEDFSSKFILKWETLPRNRDRPYPEPWPEPSQLYLYELE